jgi:hypothetical protein
MFLFVFGFFFPSCYCAMLLLSDDDMPKKDAATSCLFSSSTTARGHPQEKAVVAKSPLPLPKKIIPAPVSKRPKRVATLTTSLEAHRPTTLSENVSLASCARLSLSFFYVYFFILLPSPGVNAEVPLSC